MEEKQNEGQSSENPAKGNASFGKASLILGIVALLGLVGILMAFANLINSPEYAGLNRIDLLAQLEVDGSAQNLVLFATLCLIAAFIGLGLGIVGSLQKNVSRIPAWIGTGLNGLMVIVFLLFLFS